MLMNSLAALALGFVLDMAFGDSKSSLYPLTLIKKLVKFLENTLRKAYAENAEAQNMAGIMLIVMTLIICLGISVGVLMVCYKISLILGIIAEALLCSCSISVKSMRSALQIIFRAAGTGNISAVHRNLKKISCRDIDSLSMEDSIKCAVETASENAVDWVIAPIFWICLFGGAGGIFCRCVNIMDNAVGYKTESCLNFGKFPAKLDDAVMFVPARTAALLMRINAAFLHLDGKNASRIYKRDRKKSLSPNSGCTQAICAGALGISLGSDEYYEGQLVRKPSIGSSQKPIDHNDVFWANQLYIGTAAYGMVLAAAVRTAVFLLLAFS